MDAELYLKQVILKIRRRSAENDDQADFIFDRSLTLGDESIGLDSMDLAEIVARIQKDFGVVLFEGEADVRTWGDVVDVIDGQRNNY